ncbi:MAG: hypothetical protein GQ557_02315 [Mycoplasmataceae bacterium]|nr:hypothetical protein [Mycoplasmataceae bacterium]
MNPLQLQSLISNYLKKHDISRSEFAKQLGYTNISKGLKRLDNFLITLQSPNPELPALILKHSDISESEFELAYSAVLETINDKLRKDFVPMIRVIPIYYPSLLISLMHLNIKVPENIMDLSYDEEIKVICDSYLDFRAKVEFDVPENWGSGAKGFRYHRNLNETLVFDKNCKLIERVY